jgi:2-polyprenyl-3-methyl-5-hydroxy-6-metoxy-1,4-benzoquinol methylase
MDRNSMAVEVFDRLAQEYFSRFMDVSLYSESLDLFCDSIQGENPEILELGCGPGNISSYLLNKRPGFKLLGTDLSPKMLEIARANNPGARFKLMDCRKISAIDKNFDGIVCGFILPYLSKAETEKLIYDAAKLLKTNGMLYLSTMEDDESRSGFQTSAAGNRMYINYHGEEHLTSTLKKNDLEIKNLQRKVYPGNDGSTTTDLLIIAVK